MAEPDPEDHVFLIANVQGIVELRSSQCLLVPLDQRRQLTVFSATAGCSPLVCWVLSLSFF